MAAFAFAAFALAALDFFAALAFFLPFDPAFFLAFDVAFFDFADPAFFLAFFALALGFFAFAALAFFALAALAFFALALAAALRCAAFDAPEPADALIPSRFNVAEPAIPSAPEPLQPWSRWKERTALVVSGPYQPVAPDGMR